MGNELIWENFDLPWLSYWIMTRWYHNDDMVIDVTILFETLGQ